MALYIVTHFSGNREVHVPLGVSSFDADFIDDIKFVQADGHELEAIKNRFAHSAIGAPEHAINYSIPMPDMRVVKWFGDIAKTIAGNI